MGFITCVYCIFLVEIDVYHLLSHGHVRKFPSSNTYKISITLQKLGFKSKNSLPLQFYCHLN